MLALWQERDAPVRGRWFAADGTPLDAEIVFDFEDAVNNALVLDEDTVLLVGQDEYRLYDRYGNPEGRTPPFVLSYGDSSRVASSLGGGRWVLAWARGFPTETMFQIRDSARMSGYIDCPELYGPDAYTCAHGAALVFQETCAPDAWCEPGIGCVD